MEENKLHLVEVRLVPDRSLLSDTPIKSPQDAINVLTKEMKLYDREVLCILNLNQKNQVINANIASIGTINASLAHPREIYKSAILSNAASIIVLHNHPSGDPTPSGVDLNITRKLYWASDVLGIPMLDHIIVGNNIYSMKEKGDFERIGIVPSKQMSESVHEPELPEAEIELIEKYRSDQVLESICGSDEGRYLYQELANIIPFEQLKTENLIRVPLKNGQELSIEKENFFYTLEIIENNVPIMKTINFKIVDGLEGNSIFIPNSTTTDKLIFKSILEIAKKQPPKIEIQINKKLIHPDNNGFIISVPYGAKFGSDDLSYCTFTVPAESVRWNPNDFSTAHISVSGNITVQNCHSGYEKTLSIPATDLKKALDKSYLYFHVPGNFVSKRTTGRNTYYTITCGKQNDSIRDDLKNSIFRTPYAKKSNNGSYIVSLYVNRPVVLSRFHLGTEQEKFLVNPIELKKEFHNYVQKMTKPQYKIILK